MDEYRARTDLLDEKGRLTRSRRSAYDTYIYNKEDARGKLSEWERCFVFGPRFALEIDYGHTPRAGIAEVRLTDFESALIARILVLRTKGRPVTAEALLSALDEE